MRAPRTPEEWRAALRAADVRLNAYAESWLNSPDFPYAGEPEATEVVMVTVAELGLPDGGTRAQLERAASPLGYEPAPVLTALAMRLAWTDQPEGRLAREHRAPDGSVTVMSLPFLSEPPGESGDQYGFYLIQERDERWLRGYIAPADHIWAPHDVLAWAKVSAA